MAQTPFRDLKSEDILSAHLSGLQHSINKMESVLNMKTRSAAGHALTPVTDQEEPSVRYRIYEGTIRNWLESPVPKIYRNGEQVSSEEYQLQAAYGVIVFWEQQAPDDTITADFEYIEARSSALEEVGVSPLFHVSGTWRTNNVGGGETSKAIYIGPNLFDAYPFPVGQTTTYDSLAINVDVAGRSGTTARLGIYRDNGSCYPGELILDAGTVPVDQEGVQALDIDITLEQGLYWLARNSNSEPGLTGLARETVYPLGMDSSFTGSPAGAIRVTHTYGALPSVYPEAGTPLFRSHYPSVWIRRA